MQGIYCEKKAKFLSNVQRFVIYTLCIINTVLTFYFYFSNTLFDYAFLCFLLNAGLVSYVTFFRTLINFSNWDIIKHCHPEMWKKLEPIIKNSAAYNGVFTNYQTDYVEKIAPTFTTTYKMIKALQSDDTNSQYLRNYLREYIFEKVIAFWCLINLFIAFIFWVNL